MNDDLVAHLPTDVRAALRFFAFFLGNGTLDVELLDGIDYRDHMLVHGSDLEMVGGEREQLPLPHRPAAPGSSLSPHTAAAWARRPGRWGGDRGSPRPQDSHRRTARAAMSSSRRPLL
ncbi:DUF7677 family protein [Streptomyces virginiae]|uniref:DUF7677 family protein n=1 Tax=Streptomyces virginiae TaxID=1961 RepID=UPI003AF39EC2